MARTSHQNVLSLPDAAQSWNFDLILPSVPGGGNSTQLTYKCKTAQIPSSAIEPVDVSLHGVKRVDAGRATYDHTMAVTLMEVVDWSSYLDLRRWRDYTRSWKNNTGADRTSYTVTAELDFYDNAGRIAFSMKLHGFWLQTIDAVSMDGAQSTGIEIPATFSFDYIDDGNSF